ncbi:hypothetical protein J31TS4_24970 [Paenibacillus sp. J31TS4]|uniref:LysM peptidoglycan-binding domain-containing protein n=1 Tax=Paenibacillus sp. J31TS4 TaxID=2807195 RepID=UPI001B1F5AA5|nr:LysM peptidoglycan-binding domain-containing protein [Paenibacillus sp. J31TS4]GIP39217.1 hypothetical protein J31TS4_24970 [Paenibacillus sp. J31TS4]
MRIHVVKKGDTLYHLAKKYNVELDKLIAANPQLANPDELEVGAKIKIPSASMPVAPPESAIAHKHIVKQGDTLWKLSQQWGVPLQAMIEANPQLNNPNILLTGQTVNIPKKAAAGQSSAHPHANPHANPNVNPNVNANPMPHGKKNTAPKAEAVQPSGKKPTEEIAPLAELPVLPETPKVEVKVELKEEIKEIKEEIKEEKKEEIKEKPAPVLPIQQAPVMPVPIQKPAAKEKHAELMPEHPPMIQMYAEHLFEQYKTPAMNVNVPQPPNPAYELPQLAPVPMPAMPPQHPVDWSCPPDGMGHWPGMPAPYPMPQVAGAYEQPFPEMPGAWMPPGAPMGAPMAAGPHWPGYAGPYYPPMPDGMGEPFVPPMMHGMEPYASPMMHGMEPYASPMMHGMGEPYGTAMPFGAQPEEKDCGCGGPKLLPAAAPIQAATAPCFDGGYPGLGMMAPMPQMMGMGANLPMGPMPQVMGEAFHPSMAPMPQMMGMPGLPPMGPMPQMMAPMGTMPQMMGPMPHGMGAADNLPTAMPTPLPAMGAMPQPMAPQPGQSAAQGLQGWPEAVVSALPGGSSDGGQSSGAGSGWMPWPEPGPMGAPRPDDAQAADAAAAPVWPGSEGVPGMQFPPGAIPGFGGQPWQGIETSPWADLAQGGQPWPGAGVPWAESGQPWPGAGAAPWTQPGQTAAPEAEGGSEWSWPGPDGEREPVSGQPTTYPATWGFPGQTGFPWPGSVQQPGAVPGAGSPMTPGGTQGAPGWPGTAMPGAGYPWAQQGYPGGFMGGFPGGMGMPGIPGYPGAGAPYSTGGQPFGYPTGMGAGSPYPYPGAYSQGWGMGQQLPGTGMRNEPADTGDTDAIESAPAPAAKPSRKAGSRSKGNNRSKAAVHTVPKRSRSSSPAPRPRSYGPWINV